MIHNYLDKSATELPERVVAASLQQIDPLNEPPSSHYREATARLAKHFLRAQAEQRLEKTGKVALIFEMEDADDAATEFERITTDANWEVTKACIWLHRRKSSFDGPLVEVGRSHTDDIAGADVTVILQPGALRPEAIWACLLHLEGRIAKKGPIITLTPWVAPDLIAELEASLPPVFAKRLAVGWMCEGKNSAESRLLEATRYASQQRVGFPAGWAKNDHYPKSVKLMVKKQMTLERQLRGGMTLD